MSVIFCAWILLDILVMYTAAAQDCPLQLHPPRVVVKYGDPVSVNCTVHTPHVGMGWAANPGAVDPTEGVQFVTWKVNNLTKWDIKPLCFVNLPGNEQCSVELNVTVYKPPDSVSISSVNPTDHMVEGSQYQLTCDITNITPVQHLTVKWFQGNKLLRETYTSENNGTSKSPVNVSQSLMITPSRADNGAEYSCVAELDLGHEGPQPPPQVKSQTININVHYKAQIECPSPVEIMEDQSLDSDQCRVEGYPYPQVTWYRNGEWVNATLPLNRSHAGQYTLEANNTIGSVVKKVNITVMYGPHLICPETYRTVENDQLNISCRADGNPVPAVTWYKDGHEVGRPVHLNRTQGGRYILIANNTHGTVNHTMDIEVQYTHEVITQPPVTTISQSVPKNTAAAQDCPLQLHPPRVVVKYGDPVSVNCTVSTPHLGMGWAANPGAVDPTEGVQFVTWKVDNLTKWDIKPQCFVNLPGDEQCSVELNVTVYKPPDSVSISSVNPTDHMVEGSQYQLTCNITNITPVQHLTVKWFKGNKLLKETYTSENNGTSKSPVNVSHTLMITPSRADNGAEYSCVAELDLGHEGPQPPPQVKSQTMKINVHYKPTINNMTDLLLVIMGYSEVLNCTADGSPAPNFTWTLNGQQKSNESTLTIVGIDKNIQGHYRCTATNAIGNDTKVVKVIFKEDHLPLIAIFVVVMIIAIICIFCCIYSVYYKNTKMGHYSLKDAKVSMQNGTVVQNGKNSSLPMKELSQYNPV